MGVWGVILKSPVFANVELVKIVLSSTMVNSEDSRGFFGSICSDRLHYYGNFCRHISL